MRTESQSLNLEIERRFLIAMPDPELLKDVPHSNIEQIYLLGEKGSTERVRKRSYGNCDTYTHTIKRRISNISREEKESEINADEYATLLKRADPKRRCISKTRYCIEYGGKLFELDLFPFWRDRAIMEIELGSEDENFSLPPQFTIIKEITNDRRYTNASLALEIPQDPI